MAAPSGKNTPRGAQRNAVTLCAVAIVELLIVGAVGIATVDNRHHHHVPVVSAATPAPIVSSR